MHPSAERRLLALEDDPDLAELLSETLGDAGFGVTVVDAFAAASDELSRSAFDLVLSDFRVGRDGVAACWQQLARLQRLADLVPVGLVSAWKLTTAEVLDRGFAFLLRKPFRAEELLEQLAAHVASAPVGPAETTTIDAYFAALEQGAWDRVAALCTDDVVYQLPAGDPRFGRTVEGRAAFARFTAQTFEAFAEPRFEVASISPLPRGVLARYRGAWRSGDDAAVRRAEGVVLFQFRGAQIARIGVRTDTRALVDAPSG